MNIKTSNFKDVDEFIQELEMSSNIKSRWQK